MSTARLLHDRMARVVLEGDRGRAFVSVVFDEAGRVTGVGIDPDEKDGRFHFVVGCSRRSAIPSTPDERHAQVEQLREFYASLVDGPMAFGEDGGPAPRWRDPRHPAQMHLDVQVTDMEAAEAAVLLRAQSSFRTAKTGASMKTRRGTRSAYTLA